MNIIMWELLEPTLYQEFFLHYNCIFLYQVQR